MALEYTSAVLIDDVIASDGLLFYRAIDDGRFDDVKFILDEFKTFANKSPMITAEI